MEELASRYGIWILLALMFAAYLFGGTCSHRSRRGCGRDEHPRRQPEGPRRATPEGTDGHGEEALPVSDNTSVHRDRRAA